MENNADWSSYFSGTGGSGGSGGGQTAQSRAEANVDYGITYRNRNDLWPLIVGIGVIALALVFIFQPGRKR